LHECFYFFQLVACVRKKFGNIEVVGQLQIRKKKILRKAAPLRTMVVFIFERNKNRNEYSIEQGIDWFKLASDEHCTNHFSFSTSCFCV